MAKEAKGQRGKGVPHLEELARETTRDPIAKTRVQQGLGQPRRGCAQQQMIQDHQLQPLYTQRTKEGRQKLTDGLQMTNDGVASDRFRWSTWDIVCLVCCECH